MVRAIPTINTQRLTLRAMRPQDFDRFAEIWASPDVVSFIGGQPQTRDEAWGKFLRNAGHWQMTGFGQWAIEEHRTKQMIGQTGFFFGARGFGEDFDSRAEVGWIVVPDRQGQGYGREAVQAAHDWFDRVITGPIVCQVHPQNAVSMHLAGRMGYKPMRRIEDAQLMLRSSPPQSRVMG